MKASRVTLLGAFAGTLLVLLPYSTLPADAGPVAAEIILNSSTVQIVHNPSPNTDVLNISLDVTNDGDAGSCDGGMDDLLESRVTIGLQEPSCATLNSAITFSFPYVEHDIGSASYGTFFTTDFGTLSSKIVALATPPGACGRWKINFQAAAQDLSPFTGNSVGLLVGDGDEDAGTHLSGTACFDVNASIGNGITKPHRGAHHARH